MPSILYENTIDWNFMFQRPQQILRQFAQHGWRVYYVNKTHVYGKAKEEVEPNLIVYHDWELAKKRIPEVDVHYITWAARHVDIGQIKSKIVIYDSLDNFPQYESLEPLILSKANIVLTASQPLFELRKQQHDNVHLIRNAVDYDFINSNTGIPNDLINIPKPFAIFSGAVGNWVDLSLMEDVAKILSLVVIGLPFGNIIPRGDNVYYLGSKAYKDLPKYYNNATLGIIPFKKTQVSYYACPIKMYEYLAAGLPVVATNIPECCIAPELVLTASSNRNFIKNVKKALSLKNEQFVIAAKTFAKDNTWEQRYLQIEDIITDYCKKRGIAL